MGSRGPAVRGRYDSLIQRFAANGLDWQEARRSRRILWMDARTALESIMVGRVPDGARFRYSLSLLCAYSRGNLYRESGLRSWSEVCQRHARVREVGPDGPMHLDEVLPDPA